MPAADPFRKSLSRRERQAGPVRGDAAAPAAKGKRDRAIRADLFAIPANPGKEAAVRGLWPLWRRGLLAEALVARADLMAGRGLRTIILAADEKLEPAITASKARIGAASQQMVRAQATAAVASWITNRQNEVREAIERGWNPRRWRGAAKRRLEALPEPARIRIEADLAELRHGLHAVNTQKAWMKPASEAVMMRAHDPEGDPEGGENKGAPLVPVPARARELARTLFRGIAAKHRWPRFQRMAMRFDDRRGAQGSWLEPARETARFAWWLTLATPSGAIDLPVRGWGRDRHDAFGDVSTGCHRPGVLGKTVLLCENDAGRLQAALTVDATEVLAESRAAYRPRTDVLGLDFGLKTLFASSEGDLVGRSFKAKLMPLAERASKEAARMQKLGKTPRDSALYQSLVERIRGLIDTEVNRALNHLVTLHRPRVLVVEKLDFREPGLSRAMNRLLTNCGRGTVEQKLGALAERLGIEVHLVDPAYTSQTCSACGYVDKKNRKGETFACRHCGMRIHADVNGARNIAGLYRPATSGPAATSAPGEEDADGRSDLRPPAALEARSSGATPATDRRRKRKTSSSSPTPRSSTLRDLVGRFDERVPELRPVSRDSRRRSRAGARESAPDPRSSNPYWRRFSSLIRSSAKPGRNMAAAAFAVAT